MRLPEVAIVRVENFVGNEITGQINGFSRVLKFVLLLVGTEVGGCREHLACAHICPDERVLIRALEVGVL